MIEDEFKKDADEKRVARWGFSVIEAWLMVRFWIEDMIEATRARHGKRP